MAKIPEMQLTLFQEGVLKVAISHTFTGVTLGYILERYNKEHHKAVMAALDFIVNLGRLTSKVELISGRQYTVYYKP